MLQTPLHSERVARKHVGSRLAEDAPESDDRSKIVLRGKGAPVRALCRGTCPAEHAQQAAATLAGPCNSLAHLLAAPALSCPAIALGSIHQAVDFMDATISHLRSGAERWEWHWRCCWVVAFCTANVSYRGFSLGNVHFLIPLHDECR